jgi:hypothetical protein
MKVVDLRGKQSVRATFRLSEKAIDAISIVAVHLGIKQKSLFDLLIEDIHSLNAIAQKIEPSEYKRNSLTQKTFVLSRKTLSTLERISKSHKTPRDALVEYSILRLLPVISQEQKKHENRKAIMELLKDHIKSGREILDKARSALGEDDSVYQKLNHVTTAYENAYQHIESFVERGKMIEDFDVESLKHILETQ